MLFKVIRRAAISARLTSWTSSHSHPATGSKIWPAIDAGARLPERRGSAGRSLGAWIAVVCRRWRLCAWHTHPLPH